MSSYFKILINDTMDKNFIILNILSTLINKNIIILLILIHNYYFNDITENTIWHFRNIFWTLIKDTFSYYKNIQDIHDINK